MSDSDYLQVDTKCEAVCRCLRNLAQASGWGNVSGYRDRAFYQWLVIKPSRLSIAGNTCTDDDHRTVTLEEAIEILSQPPKPVEPDIVICGDKLYFPGDGTIQVGGEVMRTIISKKTVEQIYRRAMGKPPDDGVMLPLTGDEAQFLGDLVGRHTNGACRGGLHDQIHSKLCGLGFHPAPFDETRMKGIVTTE